MSEALEMAIRSYYGPLTGLILFAVFLQTNQLLTRREKNLFACELTVVGMMLLATSVDACVSQASEEVQWRARAVASALQFALAPMAPFFLAQLCHPMHRIKQRLFALPVVINFLVAIGSWHTGLVARLGPQGQYIRGPLFVLPFVAVAIYLGWMFVIFSRNSNPGRRMESWSTTAVALVMIGASGIEVILHLRGVLWSTATICLILLFFALTVTKVLYDPLTGTYSRLAYQKRLECIRWKSQITLAMVDMNGLKKINDCLGHGAGDQAICQVAQALSAIRCRGLKVYRYGGDEFVLIGEGLIAGRLERELEGALVRCGTVEGMPVSFAYGVRQGQGAEVEKLLGDVDSQMYVNKAQNLADDDVSHLEPSGGYFGGGQA